jgi:predicted enzyme related to lactoylglutathione lyase
MGRTRFSLYVAAPDLPRLAQFVAATFDLTAQLSPDGSAVRMSSRDEVVVTAIETTGNAIPGMLTSFHVEGAEHAASEAERLGARVVRRRPGDAAFIMLLGRTGEPFAIEEAPAAVRPPAVEPRHELWTRDVEAALSFYTALFGWTVETRSGAVSLLSDGTSIATVRQMDDAFDDLAFRRAIGQADGDSGSTVPHWMPYITVRGLTACLERCRFFGGRVVISPSAVPIHSPVALVRDPQGAHIGIREP